MKEGHYWRFLNETFRVPTSKHSLIALWSFQLCQQPRGRFRTCFNPCNATKWSCAYTQQIV